MTDTPGRGLLPPQGLAPKDPVESLVGPIAPRPVARRDRVLPILIIASLVVHATVMLPSLLGPGETSPVPPHEIPVEIVQLSPKPAEKPKPAAQPQPPPRAKAAERPNVQAKADPPKPAPKPKQVAQKPPPKPSPQKVAAKQPQPKPEPASTSQRLQDLLGPMPAVALPGVAADGTEGVSYTRLVLSQVAKAKKEGRYQGVPGAASVAFTLGDAGEVATVAIVRPSGDPNLDEEAIAMIKRGAPYPAPPPGGRRDYTITLRFQPLI